MKRAYESSHPWLRFGADLTRLPVEFWMLLGEARSKCEHLASVPMLPATAERMHLLHLSKGAAATTAIEGNTLSEEEVLRRVEHTLELPASREYLGREIDNFVRTVNESQAEVLQSDFKLTVPFLMRVHRQILEGLPLSEEVVPGELRKHKVTVARYRGAPPEDVEFLLEKLCGWLPTIELPHVTGDVRYHATVEGILRAVLAHLYLAWIHPFGDGNGRVARFAEFSILVNAGVPSSAAHLLSNHYNQTRSQYYQRLDEASRSGGDVAPFIHYAVLGLVDQMTQQLEHLHGQHRELVWRMHIDDQLPEPRTVASERQRQLLLALGLTGHPVAPSDVADLNPALARAYARRTQATLMRDLKSLELQRLVVRTAEGFRARTEVVLSMFPKRGRGRAQAVGS